MCQLREEFRRGGGGEKVGVRTSRHAMNFMLYKEVNHRNDGSEEGRRDVFPIFDCLGIRRAQDEAADRPGDCGYQIRDHKDIVPIVIVGRRDIGPAAAHERTKQSHGGHKFRKGLAGARG